MTLSSHYYSPIIISGVYYIHDGYTSSKYINSSKFQIIINGQLVDQIEQLKFFEEEAANLESCEIDVLKFLIEQVDIP